MEEITHFFTSKDLQTDQEVRWCPGCGDYAILNAVQRTLPEIGVPKEKIVFISGIGCSSRFPYYMNTYGIHSIHGRALPIAIGLKTVRPELSIWVITGDGDSLSIGGNHTIHFFRRNSDINVLMFNNKIYGLTKGQFSPTSEEGKITKSSPQGTTDYPFNTISLTLGAGATFIARTLDKDIKHQQHIYKQAHAHSGASFVEIYQNCNVFNDGAFEQQSAKENRSAHTIMLEDNKPLIFGQNNELMIALDGFSPVVKEISNNSINDAWVHNSQDKTKAFILSTFSDINLPHPLGVFYQENKPTLEQKIHQQLANTLPTNEMLEELLRGQNSWEV